MNKKLLIFGGIALFIIVVVGVILMFLNSGTTTEDDDNGFVTENLVEMNPEDVGLTLTSQQNNQQLVMELTDLSEVESFEYELSYDAVENGETVSRGTFGSGPNPDEEGEDTITRVIDLGTCSAGKCKYDKGVEEVQLALRVNLTNGEVGLIETTHTLE